MEETYFFRDGLNQGLIRFLPPGGRNLPTLGHRSWAAETPDKYERDLQYLTYVFVESKFPVIEKFMNGAFVTPTPGLSNPPTSMYELLN